MQLLTIVCQRVVITVVYRSPTVSLSCFAAELSKLLQRFKGLPKIICGDFNFNSDEKNVVSKLLHQHSFSLANPSFATHVEGGSLDHIYSNAIELIQHSFLHPLYFSDHDAICTSLNKDCFWPVSFISSAFNYWIHNHNYSSANVYDGFEMRRSCASSPILQ